MAPRAKAARTVPVATLDSIKGIVVAATQSATQVIALGTEQSRGHGDSLNASLKEQNERYWKLQDRYDRQSAELQEERNKNGANAVELKKQEVANNQAILSRLTHQEGMALVDKMFGDVIPLLKMKQIAASNAGIVNRPPTEALIEKLLADLSPATVELLWRRMKHAILPLLSQKTFMVSVYQKLYSPPDVEAGLAIRADLGPSASDRIAAIAHSVGLDE